MKLGVSSYSYTKCLQSGAMTLPDVIREARAAGFAQIEMVDMNMTPPEGQSHEAYARELRALSQAEGIEISGYMVHADFLSGGDPAQEAARVKGCLDIAAVLGAKRLRHDASWGIKGRQISYKEAVDTVAAAIRDVAAYGKTLGIRTMTENHGQFLQESYRMEYLVAQVNHPNYGLLVDIGNFLCADEDPISAIGRVAPYAFHAHAKDFLFKDGAAPCPGEGWFSTRGGHHLRGTIVGHGVVPVRQCLQMLLNAGYAGDFALEFEGLEDPVFATRAGLAFLKNIVS